MRRDIELLLADIQDCIDRIERFTAHMTANDYLENDLVRSAVERQFITIGEAIRRIRHISGQSSARVDGAMAIAGFRNMLVHEYEQVDDGEVWRIIQLVMPKLKQQIDAWAEELGMDPPPETA